MASGFSAFIAPESHFTKSGEGRVGVSSTFGAGGAGFGVEVVAADLEETGMPLARGMVEVEGVEVAAGRGCGVLPLVPTVVHTPPT